MKLSKAYWVCEKIYKYIKRILLKRSTIILPILPGDTLLSLPIKVTIKSNPEIITEIFINGRKAQLKSTGLRGQYICKKGYFEPWENVLAFPPDFVVKEVKIHTDGNIDDFKNEASIDHYGENYSQETISASWAFIENSMNHVPYSEYSGTYFACYDDTYSTYRLNSWVWCSAIIVELMVKEAENQTPELEHVLLAKAEEVGRVLLRRWQQENQQKVGGMVIRWDISYTSTTGIIPWRAPNDISYIGTHCFIPLFRATDKQEYLNAAIEMGEWIIENALLPDGRLLVGYREDRNEWDDTWLYVDAGFTACLFAELYLLTQENIWLENLTLFVDWYIQNLFTSDELFLWTWPDKFWRNSKKVFSRGQAWALEGLISAWKITKKNEYLEVIQACIKKIIDKQNMDGSWSYMLGLSESGADNKGTPILAYQFLRFIKEIPNRDIEKAAKDALMWCERNQQLIDQSKRSYGGIFSINLEGAISGQNNISTAFLYSSAYYLLAKHIECEL